MIFGANESSIQWPGIFQLPMFDFQRVYRFNWPLFFFGNSEVIRNQWRQRWIFPHWMCQSLDNFRSNPILIWTWCFGTTIFDTLLFAHLFRSLFDLAHGRWNPRIRVLTLVFNTWICPKIWYPPNKNHGFQGIPNKKSRIMNYKVSPTKNMN